ncbi:MAG TPA: CoA-binding protein [Polyangiaceae bacterium]|nr:CoA-binding protein [Polyangiaceae bacterium]
METAERILRSYDTWAVVGASRDASKAAARVPGTLAAHGFRMVPVNPRADGELFGETIHPSLAAIPFPVQVVQVFRPSEEAAEIARQAVAIGAKALWLQLGIESEEARRIAEEAGLDYVEDRCAAVERSIHQVSHPKRS